MIRREQRGADIYLADVMTGFFAVLAEEGIEGLSIRNNLLTKAFEQGMTRIRELADEEGLMLRFRIKGHPIHEDSETMDRELLLAQQRGITHTRIPFDEAVYTNIRKEEADRFLKGLPGGAGFYRKTTQEIIRNYRNMES